MDRSLPDRRDVGGVPVKDNIRSCLNTHLSRAHGETGIVPGPECRGDPRQTGALPSQEFTLGREDRCRVIHVRRVSQRTRVESRGNL